MKRRFLTAALTLGLLTLALPLTPRATAQEAAPPVIAPVVAPVVAAPPAADDEVVVTARRTEDAVRAFVGEIAAAVNENNQLARWDRRICPGISGVKPAYARAVLDRIAQRAFEIGLDVDAPGCKANILVLVTPTPDAVAKEMVDHNREVLGWHAQRGQISEGRDGLRDFMASDAAVRWWHVGHTSTNDGVGVGETAGGDAQAVTVDGVSHIHRSTRTDFGGAFIVVDANRIGGLPLGALADYLAMVALAQLEPDTDTSQFPTILNIFNGVAGGPPAFASLTDWDRAYLGGLYNVQRNRSVDSQQRDIVQTMTRSLSKQ